MTNALQDRPPESRAFPYEGILDGEKRPGILPYRPRLAHLTVFVLTIFFSELAIMLVLVGDFSPTEAALIDALLITLILLPALYFLVLRPASRNLERRIRAEQALASLGRILDMSTNEIYLFDAGTLRFIEVSEGARRNLGYTLQELMQLTPVDIKPEFTQERFRALISPLLTGDQKELIFETDHKRKDGSLYPVEVRLQYSVAETVPAYVAIVQDISERRQYIADLEHKALYDSLTDLPNRLTLQDRLQQAINTARREAQPLAVVIVDLSRLKEVNDILGHQNGDQVLREIALRLKQALRQCDTVARLGGDEFAVVLLDVDKERISTAARKIQKIFDRPVLIGDTPLDIEAELGIALYPDHGDNPTVLLQHADIAMRMAKSEQSGMSVYDSLDDPFSMKRLKRFGELRQSIHDHELTLYYQPKIDIKAGKVIGVEALARWPHPMEGMISPAEFVPMIEQSGLIRPFTMWVLRQALAQCHLWMAAGIDLKIAVNLSTRNLLDPGLPDEMAKLLETCRIDPNCILLEVTESAVMFRPDRTMEILNRLDAMGLELSIDDFGTGYSSLARLHKLPVTEIKIDRCFVSEMIQDSDNAMIVRSTIELAHNLGLKVVAEGVENGDTLNMLMALGCDIAQGYHLGRPQPPEALSRWLSESPWGLGHVARSALN